MTRYVHSHFFVSSRTNRDPNEMCVCQVHYLVDGGYVNNVPADVMKQRFPVETIIACDVGVDVVLTGKASPLYSSYNHPQLIRLWFAHTTCRT